MDSTLISVQVLAFNNLQFGEIENIIKPVHDLYEKVVAAISMTYSMPDENRAKLEGTYGQMCGFKYNLTGEEQYFAKAEQSLKNDIKSCVDGSYTWEQGMGFLAALYWRNGKLDQAMEQFFLETGTSRADIGAGIFDLDRFDLFDGPDKLFLLLHRLNICALVRQNGQAIQGLDTMKNKIGTKNELSRYPRLLSAKWLAVMYMQENNYSEALKLLNLSLGRGNSTDFAIVFIRLPMKILADFCMRQLGKQSDFSLENEVQNLESLQKGTGEILQQLGLDRFREYSGECDPYAIALLPPYYYA